VLAHRIGNSIGKLIEVAYAELGEIIRAAECDKAAYCRRRCYRIILRKIEIPSNERKPKLVYQGGGENMSLTCREIGILQILVSGKERSKIQVADDIRLIRLVKNVSDREVIVFSDPVIEPESVIPGCYWLINVNIRLPRLNCHAVRGDICQITERRILRIDPA
jgi:hypothetical protein